LFRKPAVTYLISHAHLARQSLSWIAEQAQHRT
jgi:hypothetical protein